MTVLRRVKDFLSCRVPFGPTLLARVAAFRTDIKSIAKSRHEWQSRESKWPDYLNLEVTNICNANCIFCAYQYQDGFRAGRGVMPDRIFQESVDTHAQLGGRFVGLAPVVGEPLLDPSLLDRIEYVIGKGLEVSFFTNGILLRRTDLERLLRSGIKTITLSTAPFDREAFAAIYRSRRYEDLVRGVETLLSLRNQLQVDFALEISFRSHLSYGETLAAPDFRNRVWPLLSEREKSSLYVVNSFNNWAGQIRARDLLRGMRLKPPGRIRWRPCRWTFVPMVCWDGKVRACACRYRGTERKEGDELEVGDMTKSTLRDIWLGAQPQRLHRRFSVGDAPGVCRDCSGYDPC